MKKLMAFIIVLIITSAVAFAGEVDVVKVNVKKTGDHTYRFSVTLRHDDTGWEHYADRWEVLSPDGKILATRVLYHPHVDEQPFTRSLSGVKIPSDIEEVIIRGHDKKHGYGGKTKKIKLPK
ncbi:MAG: hypothetical protein IEMM0008_1348 [bacterium]|nr:MAG: hypothetical protein IEMM0008_1348 [bacterium]